MSSWGKNEIKTKGEDSWHETFAICTLMLLALVFDVAAQASVKAVMCARTSNERRMRNYAGPTCKTDYQMS